MRIIMIIQVILMLALGVGWIMNLVKLIGCDFEAPYKAEVIYGLGTFTPICIVTGWIDIDDVKKEE